MTDTTFERGGVRVLMLDAAGPRLAKPGDTNDFISAAWEHQADMVAAPATRFADDFFVLRSGLAGEAIQKFVNYGIRLVVLGDIASHVAASDALRDFVYESNRGRHVWFLATMAELEARLDGQGT